METHNQFGGLMNELNKMQKDLGKSSEFLVNRFCEITKKFDVMKEKKGKVNKKPATVFLNVDKSVLITFENPEDGIKLFEGIK